MTAVTAPLLRASSSSLPFCACQRLQRLFILCSSSSASASTGAMCGSSPPFDPWRRTLSSDSSQRTHLKRSTAKRLQIAGIDQDELLDPWLLADEDSRFAELHGVHFHYKVADPAGLADEEGSKEDDVWSRASSSSSSSASSASETAGLSSTLETDMLSSSSATMSPHPDFPNPSKASPDASNPQSARPISPVSEQSPLPSGIPAILLHGFGASLFSWERVLKPLAKVLGSRVVAFDRPAFGLTTRIKVPVAQSASGNLVPLNPYSVSFSSAATIAFINFLQARKAVLIGHSAGCIVAADAYFRDPERVAAIIMVAPALFAPISLHQKAKARQDPNVVLSFFSKVWAKIMWFFSIVGAMVQVLATSIRLLWYRLLSAILRSDLGHWLIRTVMDKLSLRAVRLAWYDKEKVDDYVIAGYTKPLRCRDWEHALLEYIIALMGSPSSNDKEGSLSRRLDEIKCPVLVITGDSDLIVPAWNAERLSKALPNAHYHVVRNCGHLPHEEKPEEFLAVIRQFMQRVRHGAASSEIALGDDSMVFMPA